MILFQQKLVSCSADKALLCIVGRSDNSLRTHNASFSAAEQIALIHNDVLLLRLHPFVLTCRILLTEWRAFCFE